MAKHSAARRRQLIPVIGISSARRRFLADHIRRELVEHNCGDLDWLVERALSLYGYAWCTTDDAAKPSDMPNSLKAAIVRAVARHAANDQLSQFTLDALNQEAAHRHYELLNLDRALR